jgi:hypothetical protein
MFPNPVFPVAQATFRADQRAFFQKVSLAFRWELNGNKQLKTGIYPRLKSPT